MTEKTIIYGKQGWPYTEKARAAYGDNALFIDVKADHEKLEEMLELSKGIRKVPVILEDNRVTIGYGGAWGVWQPVVYRIGFPPRCLWWIRAPAIERTNLIPQITIGSIPHLLILTSDFNLISLRMRLCSPPYPSCYSGSQEPRIPPCGSHWFHWEINKGNILK